MSDQILEKLHNGPWLEGGALSLWWHGPWYEIRDGGKAELVDLTDRTFPSAHDIAEVIASKASEGSPSLAAAIVRMKDGSLMCWEGCDSAESSGFAPWGEDEEGGGAAVYTAHSLEDALNALSRAARALLGYDTPSKPFVPPGGSQ